MYSLNQLKQPTPLFLMVVVLVYFGLLPTGQGVVPAPDGCYPNFTTAEGCDALNLLTTGAGNTALGWRSLFSDGTGNFNTSVGAGALVLNNADSNTAVGAAVLLLNTSGTQNTATGTDALVHNTTGNGNTALGALAGSALTTGDNNIDIGHGVIGVAGESNTIRLGANLPDTPGASACHIGGIYNQSVDPATVSPMGIDATGKLGTVVSSRRFKHDIKPMDKASEVILALKPVTFHYKSDAKNTPCFGLIAEEVAEVNPDLVMRNKDGEIYTVRYDQVNAMLLNEFLKEHHQVQDLKTIVAGQQKQIEALTAGLQKVSAQLAAASPSDGGLELSKPAPQTVCLPTVALREGGNNQ